MGKLQVPHSWKTTILLGVLSSLVASGVSTGAGYLLLRRTVANVAKDALEIVRPKDTLAQLGDALRVATEAEESLTATTRPTDQPMERLKGLVDYTIDRQDPSTRDRPFHLKANVPMPLDTMDGLRMIRETTTEIDLLLRKDDYIDVVNARRNCRRLHDSIQLLRSQLEDRYDATERTLDKFGRR